MLWAWLIGSDGIDEVISVIRAKQEFVCGGCDKTRVFEIIGINSVIAEVATAKYSHETEKSAASKNSHHVFDVRGFDFFNEAFV